MKTILMTLVSGMLLAGCSTIMQWREAAMLDPNNRNARRRLRNAGVAQ